MKNKIIFGVLLGIMLAVAMVSALDYYITQEQLDDLDVETMTWENLLCESDGLVYVWEGNLITFYNCLDFEYLEERQLYHFYTANFWTSVPLEPIVECVEEHGLDRCEDQYWSLVIQQAMANVDRIIHQIEEYQTGYGGNWPWERDIF